MVTDGSGHDVDGMCGSVAIVSAPRFQFFDICVSASTHSTVGRAEHEAMLGGLQMLLTWLCKNGNSIETLRNVPARVHWTSDRQDLVLSTARDPDTQKTFYARRTNPDLWARYEFYEKVFQVTTQHIKRNTTPMQRLADHLAGRLRTMIKSFTGESLEGNLRADAAAWVEYWGSPMTINARVAEILGAPEDRRMSAMGAVEEALSSDARWRVIRAIVESPELWRPDGVPWGRALYTPT